VDPSDLKLIYIEWYDACSSSGWNSPDKLDYTALLVKTVGWLLKEEKNTISIVHSNAENHDVMGLVTIPKGWIKKRKYLKC